MTGKRGLTQNHAAWILGNRSLKAAAECIEADFGNLPEAPAFVFSAAGDVCRFIVWALGEFTGFQTVAARTSAHDKPVDPGCTVEGNHVHLSFKFTTGDASGQNRISSATQAIRDDIIVRSPVKPLRYQIDYPALRKLSGNALPTQHL